MDTVTVDNGNLQIALGRHADDLIPFHKAFMTALRRQEFDLYQADGSGDRMSGRAEKMRRNCRSAGLYRRPRLDAGDATGSKIIFPNEFAEGGIASEWYFRYIFRLCWRQIRFQVLAFRSRTDQTPLNR